MRGLFIIIRVRDIHRFVLVRWLIEDEESWFFESEFCEHHESFLSFREGSDWGCHKLTSDEESSSKRTEIFIKSFSIRCFEETIIDFLIEVKRREILPVVSDFYIWSNLYTLGSTIGD